MPVNEVEHGVDAAFGSVSEPKGPPVFDQVQRIPGSVKGLPALIGPQFEPQALKSGRIKRFKHVASAQERDAEFTGVAAHGYGN